MEQESPLAESVAVADNSYVVEAILDKESRNIDGEEKEFYLIRWEGYPNEQEYTWEPIEHLIAVTDMIEQFEKSRRIAKQKAERADRKTKKISIKQDARQENQKKRKHNEDAIDQPRSRKLRKYSLPVQNKQTDLIDYLITQQRPPSEKREEKTMHRKLIPQQPTTPKKPMQEPSQHSQNLSSKKQSAPCKYGQILNHLYKQGVIYYQVAIVGKESSTKIRWVQGSQLRSQCPAELAQYLEKYLIELEQLNHEENFDE